jgi:hypothetical protein
LTVAPIRGLSHPRQIERNARKEGGKIEEDYDKDHDHDRDHEYDCDDENDYENDDESGVDPKRGQT